MRSYPSEHQLAVAARARAVAKTGVQRRVTDDYIGRCYHKAPPDTVLTFARYHNPGYGYWVQLTLTRRTAACEPLPMTEAYIESWVYAFFGEDRRLVRTDRASGAFGRRMGTLHFRLFTDENFRNPYQPARDVILD